MSRRSPSQREAPLFVKLLVNFFLISVATLLGVVSFVVVGNEIVALVVSFGGIVVLSALFYRPLIAMLIPSGRGRRRPPRRRR